MTDFKSAFQDYGGDYAATMGRFLGNEAMYLRFLDMLFQDENLGRLGEALAASDWKTAFEAAHTLKGVAGNLGLAPFYRAVCAIVEPLRQGREQDYAGLYADIQEEFLRVTALHARLREGA